MRGRGGCVRPFLERKGRAPKNFLEEVFMRTHLGIFKRDCFFSEVKTGWTAKAINHCFMGICYFISLNKKNTPNIVFSKKLLYLTILGVFSLNKIFFLIYPKKVWSVPNQFALANLFASSRPLSSLEKNKTNLVITNGYL